MASAESRAPRTGALSRGAVTGLAVARAGLADLSHRVQRAGRSEAEQAALRERHEAEVGRILFQALSQLRGCALKVSQMLSLEGSFLPPGIRRELARACHQAPPLNRALVGRVFRQSLGAEPEALFSRFEPVAFAAASLGQVHAAWLDGQGALAVKVQYPGIAGTLRADMRLLRHALRALGQGALALPDATVIEPVMDEIEATLQRELDYLEEASQLRWFARHAAWPGLRMPTVIDSHSSTQVLTMSRLDGLHLEAWLATGPAQAERDALGQILFDWFMHTGFGLGRLYADLHPGNLLFGPGAQLGVLDFGCIRALSPAFRAGLLATWAAWAEAGPAPRAPRLLAAYRALGVVAPTLGEPEFERELLPALAPLLDWQTEAFMRQDAEGCFAFGAKSALPPFDSARQRVLTRHLARVPAEMPVFERAWLGLMHVLSRLGARIRPGTVAARQPSSTGCGLSPPAP